MPYVFYLAPSVFWKNMWLSTLKTFLFVVKCATCPPSVSQEDNHSSFNFLHLTVFWLTGSFHSFSSSCGWSALAFFIWLVNFISNGTCLLSDGIGSLPFCQITGWRKKVKVAPITLAVNSVGVLFYHTRSFSLSVSCFQILFSLFSALGQSFSHPQYELNHHSVSSWRFWHLPALLE